MARASSRLSATPREQNFASAKILLSPHRPVILSFALSCNEIQKEGEREGDRKREREKEKARAPLHARAEADV